VTSAEADSTKLIANTKPKTANEAEPSLFKKSPSTVQIAIIWLSIKDTQIEQIKTLFQYQTYFQILYTMSSFDN
jgi:hypothetical protein